MTAIKVTSKKNVGENLLFVDIILVRNDFHYFFICPKMIIPYYGVCTKIDPPRSAELNCQIESIRKLVGPFEIVFLMIGVTNGIRGVFSGEGTGRGGVAPVNGGLGSG